jgi:hypothetical protein
MTSPADPLRLLLISLPAHARLALLRWRSEDGCGRARAFFRGRTIIDIERAAKLTVREDRRLVKWQPIPENAFERNESHSLTAEDEVILVTMPPEANEAA